MSSQAMTDPIRAYWRERFGRADPKIICVGLNYREHAGEQNADVPVLPLLFGKFANTLCSDGDAIRIPADAGHVDAEAELAVVIREEARDVALADAMSIIEGYCCANDVSARDIQFADGQFFRGKGFDTFCPVGPRITPADEIDVGALRIQQRLNGEVLQDATTRDMIFDVPAIIAYVSRVVTLERGDLILTGTPPGVGVFRQPKVALRDGDVVEVEIECLGTLRNRVVVDPASVSHD